MKVLNNISGEVISDRSESGCEEREESFKKNEVHSKR